MARSQRKPGNGVPFTAVEERFFEAGDRLADEPALPADSFDDLDDGRDPESFWSRLVRRPATA